MAYIGSEPNYGTVASQRFTGDGSTTSFGLTQTVPDGESIIVTIGNVVQEPGASAAYTASGNTLAFSAAPANGDVIMVRYLGRSIDTPSSYTNVIRFKYVATASQTVFTGADINSAILAFTGSVVDVFLNGVHLDETDYTISNGDTVTLATGATLNDEIVIIAYRAQTFADVVAGVNWGNFCWRHYRAELPDDSNEGTYGCVPHKQPDGYAEHDNCHGRKCSGYWPTDHRPISHNHG